MGYAIRNDGFGFRAVDGESDINESEWYTEAVPPAPVPAPLTADELVALANDRRDQLLAEAAIRITPLQYAVDIGESTPESEAELLAWKQYWVALDRITQQAGYPAAVEWPVKPT